MAFPGNVYALCLKRKLRRVKYRSEFIHVGPTAQAGNTADCRESEQLFGIGASTNSAIMTIVRMFGADGPDTDLDLDDGVTASVDNNLIVRADGLRGRDLRPEALMPAMSLLFRAQAVCR